MLSYHVSKVSIEPPLSRHERFKTILAQLTRLLGPLFGEAMLAYWDVKILPVERAQEIILSHLQLCGIDSCKGAPASKLKWVEHISTPGVDRCEAKLMDARLFV